MIKFSNLLILLFPLEVFCPVDPCIRCRSAGFGFGLEASVGSDINGAWFQEVAAYDGNDGTYASQHLKGAPTVHYDRASSMIDARNLGQSIYHVTPQSPASTLWNFWMNN